MAVTFRIYACELSGLRCCGCARRPLLITRHGCTSQTRWLDIAGNIVSTYALALVASTTSFEDIPHCTASFSSVMVLLIMTTIISTSLYIFHPFAACLNCTSVVGTPSALLSFSSIGTCLVIVDQSYAVRIGQGQLATYVGCCSLLLLCRNKRTSYNESSLKLARKYVRCRNVRDSVACEQALVDPSVRGTRGNTLSRDSEQLKADGRHVHLDDNVDRRTRDPVFPATTRKTQSTRKVDTHIIRAH